MNERIRSKEVRLIDQDGQNHGIIPTSKALQMAYDADLDLVLINPNQEPPVAKILNYGKYKYEQEKRAKEAKKKQHTVEIKEIKIRYKIDTHDYQVRIKSIEKFTNSGLIVPARKDVANSAVFLDGKKPDNAKIFLDIIPQSKPTPVTVDYREVLDNLKTQMETRFN